MTTLVIDLELTVLMSRLSETTKHLPLEQIQSFRSIFVEHLALIDSEHVEDSEFTSVLSDIRSD